MAVRRTAREQAGREHDAQHLPALDLGRQESEAVQRVGDVLAPVAEGEHGHRRIADTGQGLEPIAAREVEIDVVEAVGRRGVDHGIVELAGLERGADRPALRSMPKLRDGRAQPDLRVELPGERVGQFLQSVPERDQPAGHTRLAVLLAFPRSEHAPERLDHRAMRSLEAVQLRQRMPHRELLRVAGEDAGDERIGDVVEDFLIEPAPNEGRDALLGRRVARVDERLAEDGELGAVREQTGREDLLRRHRQRQELLLLDDVTVARGRGGREDAGFEAQLGQEGREGRRGRSQRVGAELRQIALAAVGPDRPADAIAGLVHHHPNAALLQSIGGGEAGDAAADDRYRAHAEPSAASNAASSASPCAAEVNAASKADGAR